MTTGGLEALKAAAQQRLAAGQGELDRGLPAGTSGGGPLEYAVRLPPTDTLPLSEPDVAKERG
ncbi:MAG TPA: hypothetical protein VEF71_00790 [Streptosporangiaceae bacterium]|nr:hypothetical protein [Streptosporangiaceae bacterium]